MNSRTQGSLIDTPGALLMAHILVVDDEADVLEALRLILEDAEHDVSMATSGEEALEMIARQQPDLVILDIIMPGVTGIEVCRRIRSDPFTSRLPILFLTAKGRPGDIVQGLTAGGDDYLVKPFEVIELPARVRALLRRGPGGILDSKSEIVVYGDLRLHMTRFEVEVDGHLIQLTPTEHRLLHQLILHAGQPVSTAQLLEDIWEYPPGTGDPNLVQAHIANLRLKIEPRPDSPQYVRNVRGRGYLISGTPRI
jgi:DNA-binding response OmpR family regulator